MATGYTRVSSASIIPGATVRAQYFNEEFNAVQAAMHNTTGHNHDGTAGGGAPVPTAGLVDAAVTTAKVADNAVTNAKAADMATKTVKGRVTAGTGDPEDLTAAQLVSIIKDADGTGTGLDADVLRGMQPATTATASTIVQRDANAVVSAAGIKLSGGIATSIELSETDDTTKWYIVQDGGAVSLRRDNVWPAAFEMLKTDAASFKASLAVGTSLTVAGFTIADAANGQDLRKTASPMFKSVSADTWATMDADSTGAALYGSNMYMDTGVIRAVNGHASVGCRAVAFNYPGWGDFSYLEKTGAVTAGGDITASTNVYSIYTSKNLTGAWLGQDVRTTASPTFSSLTAWSDIVVGWGAGANTSKIRLAADASTDYAYLQVGNSGDDNGKFRICRWLTGNAPIDSFEVYSLGTTFSGGGVTVGSGMTAQYPAQLTIAESTHTTSRHAGIQIGTDWHLSADPSGIGVKDLGLWHPTHGFVLNVGTNGVTDFKKSPTVNANAIWHDGNAPKNLSASGYAKLPNGLIMQWGTVTYGTTAGGSTYTTPVTLPTSFPSACITVIPEAQTAQPGSVALSYGSAGTTGFTLYTFTGVVFPSLPVTWVAFGY